jgi:hypothetical protein
LAKSVIQICAVDAAGKLVTNWQQLTQSGNSFAGKWMDGIDITFSLAGLALDDSRIKAQNEVRHTNGDVDARLTSTGGFMDLVARNLVAPPTAIVAAYLSPVRPMDCAALPSSIKA